MVTSFYIAAKYLELAPPVLSDMEYICNRSYDENDIINV